jgi:hypothetical protein
MFVGLITQLIGKELAVAFASRAGVSVKQERSLQACVLASAPALLLDDMV